MSTRTARCSHGWRWYAACPDCASEALLARLEWDKRHGVVGRLRRKVLEQMWASLVDPDPNHPRPMMALGALGPGCPTWWSGKSWRGGIRRRTTPGTRCRSAGIDPERRAGGGHHPPALRSCLLSCPDSFRRL
jgi:hypothetical protein